MVDAKLREGVEYFEQMLRVMPEDRTALEFLTLAYEKSGETAKYETTLAALARVLLAANDLESAAALVGRLESCADAAAKAVAIRVKAAVGRKNAVLEPERSAPAAEETDVGGILRETVLSESVLVEALVQSGTLPDGVGASLLEQLRGLPPDGAPCHVSALSALERDHAQLVEPVMAYLADMFKAPPVPLESLDVDAATAKRLPKALVTVRGLVPFGAVGDVRLIATPSVHDAALKGRVEDLLDEPCAFFLATPSAVEAARERLYPEDKRT